MIYLLLAISMATECDIRFQQYALDNKQSFQTEEARTQAQSTYCLHLEQGKFQRNITGIAAKKQQITEMTNTPVPPAEPIILYDDTNIIKYNRIDDIPGIYEKCIRQSEISYRPTAIKEVHELFRIKGDLPKSVFLGDYALLHKSQDQGVCGSCFAFASRSVM